MKYFLYRHTRLDTDEIFYVGIGTKPSKYNTHKQEFKRAYTSSNRSKHWRNIKKKYGIKVEIIYQSDDYEYIKQQEIVAIKSFGRRDLGKGNLVNFTDGGDGTLGCISAFKGKKHSKETIEKLRVAKIGRKICEITKNAMIKANNKKVYQFDMNNNFIKEWSSCTEAAQYYNIERTVISATCRQNKLGKDYSYNNFKWKYEK